MDWLLIGTVFLLVMMVLGVVFTVLLVDRPREPISGAAAVAVLIFNSAYIAIVYSLAKQAGVL